MTILAAIRREERKLEKKLGQLQHRLNGMRTAAKALGHTAECTSSPAGSDVTYAPTGRMVCYGLTAPARALTLVDRLFSGNSRQSRPVMYFELLFTRGDHRKF